MKRILQLIALVALMAMPWATQAQNTLTVCDGTATNNYVPFYGYYADESQNGQMLYPADSLTAMVGMEITEMVFYVSEYGSYGYDIGNWIVSLGTTTETSLSGINTAASLSEVYSGPMTFNSDNTLMTVTFTNGYTYTGGNLLVQFNHPVSASYRQIYFYGVNATGAAYTYNDSRNFLPKVTFSYGNPPSCIRPESLTATDVTSDGLTLSWVDAMNTGATYSIDYWTSTGDTTTVTSTTTSYTFTGLDASSLYYFSVKAVCSASDESTPLVGSFATACAGSTCDMTLELSSTSTYANPFSYYGASVELFQNGVSLGAYSNTTTVEVCGDSPVVAVYHGASYSYYDSFASITVRDGGGVAVYTGGAGDTLCTVATPCPTCIPPTALAATADSSQIEFSWTPRSGAAQFIVFLNDSIVDDNVTDTFYTFMDLNANTQYTVGVQSVCSSDDSSAIATTTVRTECGSMAVPFYEDFSSYDYGTFPPCWHRVLAHNTDPSVNTEIYGLNGSMYMFMIASGDSNLFVSPSAVPLPGDQIHVSYDAYLSGSGWIKAGVMTNYNDVSTFVALDSVGAHSFNNNFESRDFNTSTLNSSDSYYIAWLYTSSSSSNRGAVDNIIINTYTGCERPATASIANVTAHTADLTWSTVDGATSYNVYYGTVNDPTSSTLQSVVVNDTTYTLSGLNGETTYYAWVSTPCGSDESDYRPFGSFTTLISCPAVTGLTVDTTTTDGATISWNAGGEETEWWVMVDSTEIGIVNNSTYTVSGLDAMTGHTLYVRPYCEAGDTGAVRSISFATACDAATCNFSAYVTDSYNDSWNGCGINIVQAGITVATIECPNGQSGQTFTYEVCSSAPVKLTFTRGSYPNELGGYIQDGGGNTVFTISNMGSYYSGDSLTYIATPCPNCVPPTSVYLSDTTATGVTIHWTAQEGQSAWIVRVDSTDFNVTDTFYTVSGLMERTAHTIGVATDCSDDTSNFVTLPFVTGCNNGECEIELTSTNDYASYGSYYNSYSPQLRVMQNGVELVNVQNTTAMVGVCSGMPVTVICGGAGTSYANPTAIIVNGGEEEVFNGTTGSMSAGDTIVYMANACPSCLKPTVQIASVDSTELSFTWTIDGGSTYLVSFDGGAYTANTTGGYTAYGLYPNTIHTFAVKAVCSVGDTSNPREVTVKTACGQMVIPYTESFEGDAMGDEPSCWTVVSTGANGYPAVDDNGHTGNNSLTLTSNSSNTAMIASNRIPLPGDSIKVSFWAFKDYGYGTLEAGMMTNPYADSTFTSMVTVTADSYTLYEFNTNTLSHDSTYYLAFRYSYNYDYYWAKVDDITISLDEGCMTPTNVTATPDTTSTNITVEWTCSGALNDFVVEYRQDGSDTWSAPQSTSSMSKLFTGLNYATAYEFRVGQVCGSDTLWAAPVSATTICGATTLPYVENFVSSTGTLPPCWNYTAPNYFHWNRWTTHAETSGDGEMMVGSGSAGQAAILPQFYAPLVKLQISFKAKLGNISEGDGIMMGAYDESTNTVEWLDTLTNANQSREEFVVFTYNYLNYSGNGSRIAIGHSHNNASDWGMAIDSIVVIELNSCNPPENLTAHNTMYPNTADDVYFTWTVSTSGTNVPDEWQLYFDTITSTIAIDSVPESQLITVDTTYYMPPINTLAEGAHYRLFVRSNCGGSVHSNWVELQNGFSTDEYWMNNSGIADTIVGCDFIIYDNGGPVAGYLHNSNSALVIQAGETNRELQLQGGFFSHGDDANTFTVYDGIGTTGTVLYTRNNTGMTETIDSVLATTTTGAMTITFTSGYYAALGYELYIHCVGEASCTRPTNLQVEMIGDGTAYATWDSTGASLYRVYHHASGDSVWNMNPSYTNSITLTGLPADVNYDFYVVAYCSATDTSAPSIIRHFNTHWEAPCEEIANLQASNISQTEATLAWTSNGTLWDVEINGTAVRTSTNPYTATGLTPNTEYTVRVRTVCDTINGRYSEWSDTIHFTTLPTTYTITVVSNNSAWGTVTGGGTFAEGASTTIKAIANEGYKFVRWQDGNTSDERVITVLSDSTFTATFEANTGIADVDNSNVTLFPNPASTMVTISGIESESTITVVDLNGREVYKHIATGNHTIDVTGYAKGAYFVRIANEKALAIRKLIVK